MASPGLRVERTVIVQAPPDRVLAAFFNPDDLSEWWQVVRSVTVARPLGTYAVEWSSTDFRDEVLGRLGGAFHGTVMEYQAGAEFFVADAYWNPPDGDPIGPMALEVRCTPQGGPHNTSLVVRQSAEDEGVRWRRYFEIVEAGWQRALADLKEYLEAETQRTRG
ncbi:MAG TPA: SRPBCC domain-containing protein [Vicinamibacterales bacterium]|nr:SRPBCC domain-containing protein [Vicinamibacterales bacterium]